MHGDRSGQQAASTEDAVQGARGRASAILLAILCAVAGVAGTAAVTYWSYAEAQREVEDRFERWASERCARLIERLHRHIHDLEAVRRFIEGSEFVDATEFRLFVTPLIETKSGLLTVAWAPRISAPERAAFEDGMGEGGQGIRQSSENGLVPAPGRPEYVPLAYAEPRELHGGLLGLDLMTWDVPSAALRRARETGQAAVTEEISLGPSSGAEKVLLAIVPTGIDPGTSGGVTGAAPSIHGYVVGVLSIAQVVEAVLRDAEPIGLPFDIWDVSSGAETKLLYRHAARLGGAMTEAIPDRAGLTHSHNLLYGGRTWRLSIEASPAFMAQHRLMWPGFVPPLGLCIAALLAMIVYSLSQRREHAERIATRHGDTIRGILEAIPDAVFRLDANGALLEAHTPDPDLLAASTQLTARRPMGDLAPAGVMRVLRPAVLEAIRDRSIRTIEYDLPAEAGLHSFEARIAPCGEQDAVAIVRDISERKRAEAEHIEYERQLVHAQKLESLGVMAGGIAHDFNNLLMAILGYTDMAQRDATDAAQVSHCLREVEKASLRAADLCGQMLAYAGKGRVVVEDIDLNEVILDTMPLLRASISKKAQLALQLQPGRVPIRADASQIRQVVMNLVINASEALNDREGNLHVSTGFVTAESMSQGASSSDCAPAAAQVYLEVTDGGCGMDSETLGRIFDPFFTTKFAGRGLGLAAVQGIVRGHGGRIDVRSTPGQGTAFRILFPALEAPKERSHQSNPGPGPDSVLQGGTILLVDDEEVVRALGKKMLERLGLTVMTACDGQEGIEVFTTHQSEIRAVVLDLTMPRMDGEEAFRELKRICPEVRVILSSGFNEQETVERFLGLGLTAFIQKPYRLADLRRVLSNVLGDQEGPPPLD